MRTLLTSALVTTLALVAAGALGVAAAEAPTTTPPRSVSVEGVAAVPIEQQASEAQADGAYRQAMAAAVSDGRGKAEFLVGKAGGALGAVQSIQEGGGWISCSGGSESSSPEYEGAQPDFGSAVAIGPVAAARGQASPAVGAPLHSSPVKRHKRHAPSAKRAAAVSCQLYAQLALSYTIG